MKKQSKKKELAPSESAQIKLVVTFSDGLGKRYRCYKCGSKFYDLGRPRPQCPSCSENQNDDPAKKPNKQRRRLRQSSFTRKDPSLDVVNMPPPKRDTDYALDIDDLVFEDHA